MGSGLMKKVFTKEHIEKLSGRTPWNKGIPMSKEAKEKLSKALIGREGNAKGKKFSAEHKRKLSLAKLGKPGPWLGKKREDMQGDKHFAWKGGYENTLYLTRKRKAQKKANGGKHTLQEWADLKKRFNNTCPSCLKKEPDIKLTRDHIVSISLGGTDNIDNIQPLCGPCNSRKGKKRV